MKSEAKIRNPEFSVATVIIATEANVTLIANTEMEALEADARRSKNRPDRRRRETIRAIKRVREADRLLLEYREIMSRVCEIPGTAAARVGAFAGQLTSLLTQVETYRKETGQE